MDPSGFFAQFSGWRILAPSNAFDYIGLFNTAMRFRDPVLMVEHGMLYGEEFEVPVDTMDYTVAYGKAKVVRPGTDVTVLTYLTGVQKCIQVADELADEAREVFLMTGDHNYSGGFCDCHFFRPDELQGLAEEAGLETIELRALEGLSSNLSEATNALKEHGDGRWERWLEILDSTQHAPAVVAMSVHFLYVGRTAR